MVKPDLTLPAFEAFTDLLLSQLLIPGVNMTDITLSDLSVVDDQGDPTNPNTKVTITGKVEKGYGDTVTTHYRRLDLSQWYSANTSPKIPVGASTSAHEMLSKVNSTLGINLQPEDVEDNPVSSEDATFTITIKPGNYLWAPISADMSVLPPSDILSDGEGNALGDGEGNVVSVA